MRGVFLCRSVVCACSTYAGWGGLWWTVGLQKSHRHGDGWGDTWLITSGDMVGWTAGTFSWVVGLGGVGLNLSGFHVRGGAKWC